jgi:molecular chaperone GrpE (heat shock protein)
MVKVDTSREAVDRAISHLIEYLMPLTAALVRALADERDEAREQPASDGMRRIAKALEHIADVLAAREP